MLFPLSFIHAEVHAMKNHRAVAPYGINAPHSGSQLFMTFCGTRFSRCLSRMNLSLGRTCRWQRVETNEQAPGKKVTIKDADVDRFRPCSWLPRQCSFGVFGLSPHSRLAMSAASTRFLALSFRKMFVTWLLTVFSVIPSCSPTSRLVSPSEIKRRACSSYSERDDSGLASA